MKKSIGTEPEYFESIRGIVFDVDGTLYSAFSLQCLIILQLAVSGLKRPALFRQLLKAISAFRKAQEILRCSDNPENDLREKQLKLASSMSGLKKESVCCMVREWMEKIPLRHIPLAKRSGLESVLRGLKKKGYRIGIFSDYPCEEKLDALGIRSFIDAVSCSTDRGIGVFKPHPRGFEVIAEKLSLSPREIMYVGDRKDVDAAGALSAGMKPALISRFKKGNRNGIVYATLAEIEKLLPECCGTDV